MSLSRLCQALLGGLSYKEGTAAKLEVSPQLGDTRGNKVLTCSFPLPSLIPRCPQTLPAAGEVGTCEGQRHTEHLGWAAGFWEDGGGQLQALLRQLFHMVTAVLNQTWPVSMRFQTLGLCLEAPPCFSATAVRGLQGFPCSPWKKWNCLAKAFQKGKRTEPGNISSNDRSPAKPWT